MEETEEAGPLQWHDLRGGGDDSRPSLTGRPSQDLGWPWKSRESSLVAYSVQCVGPELEDTCAVKLVIGKSDEIGVWMACYVKVLYPC